MKNLLSSLNGISKKVFVFVITVILTTITNVVSGQGISGVPAPGDTLFVYLNNGRLDVYPYSIISDFVANETSVNVVTNDEVIHFYNPEMVKSVGFVAPANKPYLTQFKIGKKYNSQVFADVLCDINPDGQITAAVPAIGKWLTPSFKTSDKQAVVYLGRELQYSDITRHSFANPVEYVVTRDGWQIMTLSDDGTMDFEPYGTNYTVSISWPTDNATSIPSIHIQTETGKVPQNKTTYINAVFSINGAGVFPDMEETPVQMKGRGNSSWTAPSATNDPKNPYRLKFSSKVKPFGLAKGKSWVLLTNKIAGSMMTNAIGMKVAQLAGTAAYNHIIPVELYINGEYRGNYNFTEKVGFAGNSVDLDDESLATLLELDTYTDETIYRTQFFNVPVKIKEPDFADETTVTTLTPEAIITDFNNMVTAAYNGNDISDFVQVDTFASYYLTNEYIMNMELLHPKSTYLYKERVNDQNSLWKFGPVWDLDWGFGHELNQNSYFTVGATSDFVNAKELECNNLWRALRSAGEKQDRAYYKAWVRFLRQKSVDELLDFCQEYYDYVKTSFANNKQRWGDNTNYADQVTKQKKWLKDRAETVFNSLTSYDLSEELPEEPLWEPYIDDSGKCGENATYYYDEFTHSLTIVGTGNIWDYDQNSSRPNTINYTVASEERKDIVVSFSRNRSDAESSYKNSIPWLSYKDKIYSVTVKEGITGVGSYAFYGCSKLKDVTVPATLRNIDTNAFSYCEELSDIHCYAINPPTTGENVFEGCPIVNTVLHVPAMSTETYNGIEPWNRFKNIVALEAPASTTIDISAAGQGTYCYDHPLDFSNVSGIKAYIASGFNPENGNILMMRVQEVPAGEGLLVKTIDGNAGSFIVPVKKTSYYYLNLFKPVFSAIDALPATEGDKTNYVLANGPDGVLFYKSSGAKLAANRAYLQIPTSLLGSHSNARSLAYTFDDEGYNTADINNILSNEAGTDMIYYNLNGQRVSRPYKGIYIREGKKIIIK